MRRHSKRIPSSARAKIHESLRKLTRRESEYALAEVLHRLDSKKIPERQAKIVANKLERFVDLAAAVNGITTENTLLHLADFMLRCINRKQFNMLVEAVILPLSRAYSFRPAIQCEAIARAALEIIKMKPRIDAKKLANYIIRLAEMPLVTNSSFDLLVEEYLRRIRENSRRLEGVAKYDSTKLHIRGNTIIRNMSREAFECWQELVNAGLAVEPIERLLMPDEQLAVLGNHYKRQVVVASRRVGMPLEVELPKLSRANRERIFRQIVDLATEMWSMGIFHNHMHAANFTINWEGGIPRVYLIDFNEASRAEPDKKITEQIYEGKFGSRMGILIKTLQELRNMPRNAIEQIVLAALYKRLAKWRKEK